MTLCRYGGRHYSKKHIGCCGSGLAASMGESATAIGSGRAVCPMPASSRRPRPTARSGSWPGVLERLHQLTHRCMAVGSLGRPPRSLATRTVGSRLPSRPRPMGTARRPRAVTVHSESCRCREPQAGRVPAWVGSVLREGPCGELAQIAPAYHRPRSGGGAGTPFCPSRGAARPPPPPNCHVRGLSEAWVG